eukprot:jgi/Psemu1/289666/fgenesh1_pg.386_\
MSSTTTPVVYRYEGTALLENAHDESGRSDEWPHPLQHRLTSEVIERTGVVFTPDFRDNEIGEQIIENLEDGTTSNLSEQRTTTVQPIDSQTTTSLRSIAFSSRRTSSSLSSSRFSSRDGKRQSIVESSGILLHGPRHPPSKTRAMIGTITTTSVLNLVVATAGGIGMVTLPGSFAQLGWLEGCGMLVIAGAAASASLYLLDWACKAVNTKESENGHSTGSGSGSRGNHESSWAVLSHTTASYGSLVATTLGTAGSLTLECLTLFYCIGQVVAYLGAIGGQVRVLTTYFLLPALGVEAVTIHECIGFVALCILFPLSLLPEEGAMRFAGVLGTICMMYIASAVLLGDGIGALRNGGLCSLSTAADTESESPVAVSSSWVVLLKNAPIFLFSMNASVTYVPVRYHHQTCLGALLSSVSTSEADPPTTSPSTNTVLNRQSRTVIATSIVAAGLVYGICSGVAYVAYCEEVPENVVDVWPVAWIPGSLARLFLAIELIVAAAGIYIPLGRASLWHLMYGPYERVAASGTSRVLLTLGIIAAGAAGSILAGGALALPLAVTSALCVTAQMFVLPGLCVARLLQGSRIRKLVPGGKCTAIGFATMGGLLGVLSLAALFGVL